MKYTAQLPIIQHYVHLAGLSPCRTCGARGPDTAFAEIGVKPRRTVENLDRLGRLPEGDFWPAVQGHFTISPFTMPRADDRAPRSLLLSVIAARLPVGDQPRSGYRHFRESPTRHLFRASLRLIMWIGICFPSCFEGSRGASVTARKTTRWPNPVWPPEDYSSRRLLLLSRFFVSRLRGFVCLSRVIEGSRRVLLACRMIALSMVLRGHPMSLGGVFMKLSCFVMRVFCHSRCPLESIFDSPNTEQVMNHWTVIVRASLPGRMADSAITSPKVRLLRNPTEPLTPRSVRLAAPFRRMCRFQLC
jgi:hypothetical protein